ncbi:MAG: hypothetical protein KDK37_15150, partial [Leptospiraceae bacterium]|nr:hypothetical protein [Leptospiraceae bacterium]
STAIPVKFELQFAKLKTFFQNVSSVTDYTLGLRGSADFPIKLGSMPTKVSVPLSMEKKLPAFIPDVSLENVDFSAPSLLDGADAALSAAFDLRIENQAAADFLVNGLNYSMDLGGSSFLQGKSLQTSRDGNASVVRVDSSLPILGAGRAFLSLFKSGGSNYRIRGDSDVAFPGSDLEKTDFQFDKSGKLSW